ncbi:hypothetical protein [Cystobacter fuscus]|uniref:hypothetical protein n=1 Tax=Cystobacter fuscus TaxID=43 RepID=UPI000BB304EC|nr:hypothetical protein [Cystobacter fuscus]
MDGVRYEPIYTGRGCGEESLIFRATFKAGRVAEAFTDGRERKYPVDHVRGVVHEFGKRVTWSDWTYHRERYFPPPPAQPPRRTSRISGSEAPALG